MTSDQAEFLLYKAAANYLSVEIPEETLLLWAERLANVPFEKGLDNLNKHIDTNDFFPKLSQIIGHEPEVFADYDQYRLNTVAFLETRKQLRLEKRLNPKLLGGANPYDSR